MRNPVLSYTAPGSPTTDITLTLFGGAEVHVRGVVELAETSPGEAAATWSKAGPAAWVSWNGDPQTIETVHYLDRTAGRRVARRATFAERISGAHGLDTIRIVLSRDTTETTAQVDYSGTDYSAADYG